MMRTANKRPFKPAEASYGGPPPSLTVRVASSETSGPRSTAKPEEKEYEGVGLDECLKKQRCEAKKCFGCTVGFYPNPEDPEMHALYTGYIDNLDRLEPEDLYELLSAIQYRKFIRPYQKPGDPRWDGDPQTWDGDTTKPDSFIPWPADVIKEHIDGGHQIHPDFEYAKSIRIAKQTEEFLSRHTGQREKDTDEDAKPNPVLIKLLLEAMDKKLSYVDRKEKRRQAQLG
jgi:hypothetical protein